MQIQPRPFTISKKKEEKAERVRKAPPTAIRPLPTTTAPRRSAVTERPCASTACGFSPTARIARPSGVRARTKAVTATVSEGEVGERRLRQGAGQRQRREGLDARRRGHARQRHAVGVGGDGGGEQRDAEADDVLREAERHGQDAVQQAEGHAGEERHARRRPRAAAPS